MTPLLPDDHPDDALLSGFSSVGRFRPHGRTEVWAEGAIVHVAATGPFNREGVDEFSAKMVALYGELPPDRRFVNLTEIHASMMATVDAWERLAEHLQRVKDSGLPLVGTAWIAAPDVEGRSLFMPRGEALFRRFGGCFATFTTLAAAEAWARDKLAH